MPFTWKEKNLVTTGDLMDAMIDLESPEEAKEFMAVVKLEQPQYGVTNIGYLTGYFDHATMKRLQEWLEVDHPIFGKKTPTQE